MITLYDYENKILDCDGNKWDVFIDEIDASLDEGAIDHIFYPKGLHLDLLDDSGGTKQYIHIESLGFFPTMFDQSSVNDLEKEISKAIYNEN